MEMKYIGIREHLISNFQWLTEHREFHVFNKCVSKILITDRVSPIAPNMMYVYLTEVDSGYENVLSYNSISKMKKEIIDTYLGYRYKIYDARIIDKKIYNKKIITSEITDKYLKKLFFQWRRGAIARNKKFELSFDDIKNIYYKTNGICPISKIKFKISNEYKKNPYGPSLDRIDNNLGYMIDNVRIVSIWVNNALNIWGEDVFNKFINGISNKPLK